MVGVLKIAAASAVLAAGFVILTETPKAPDVARFLAERFATERAATPESVPARPRSAVEERCGGAWPYIDESCLKDGPEGRSIRRIDLDRVHLPARPGLVQAASAAANPVR